MIEVLESRIAPAALSAVAYHGVMQLKGTPDGPLTITELPDGKVQFQSGNNGPSNPIGPITYIVLLLDSDFQRNDTVNFNLPTGYVHNLLVYPNGGNDTYAIKTGGEKVSATIYGADGNDTVNIDAVASLRYLNFQGGQGDNTLNIAGKVVTTASFTSFTGVDTLNLPSGGDVGTIYTQLGSGNDVITLNGVVRTLAQLQTAAGQDTITLTAFSSVKSLSIIAGADNDFVSLAGPITGPAYVNMSDGNDVLTLVQGVRGGNLNVQLGRGDDIANFNGSFYNATIDGGLDNDRVDLHNGYAIGNILRITLGAGNNIVSSGIASSTTLNTAARVIVTASTGNDQVQLSGMQVTYGISVSLGSGINTFHIPVRDFQGVEIAAIRAGSLTYSGGVGVDTITVQSSESVIGTGFFSLSYGNDVANFSGNKSMFTSAIRVYGSLGTDTLTGKNLFANIARTFSSIENQS